MVRIARFSVALALASFAVWACSEATDGLTPPELPDAAPADGAPSTSSGSSGTSSGSSGSSGFDATTSSRSPVLLNEISGSGEWIELVNGGSTEAEIGGWKVADRDQGTGEPKFSEAATIPVGTKLAAGAYGIVIGGGLDAGKDCPGDDLAFCVKAEFGVSNKKGETIFLISSDGGIVGTAVYPPEAADGGDTWGRIPNADPKGTFEVTAATPGAENEKK